MKKIELHQIKKDNSNIRKYSDPLWRELRKERFKKAKPEIFTNEMAAEQLRYQMTDDIDFRHDAEMFSKRYLTEREAKIFALFLFGGKLGQADIGSLLGVSQSTITNELVAILDLFRKYYFTEHRGNSDYEFTSN